MDIYIIYIYKYINNTSLKNKNISEINFYL